MADLDREDADSKTSKKYALLVADTIVVPLEGQASPEKEKENNLTQSCPKNWTDVAYFFKVDLTNLRPSGFLPIAFLRQARHTMVLNRSSDSR